MLLFYYYAISLTLLHFASCEDVWEKVPCDEDFTPENCDFGKIPHLTVEDFDRCGPAVLNRTARNYFLGAAGRRVTYNANKDAYKRIRIVPKMLRDVSSNSLAISTLGQKLSMPIGLSPVALQTFAHPLGEIATVHAISDMGTVMMLSSYAGTSIEDVAAHARGGNSHLWMQVYIFRNRSFTENLVRRAERAGFEGIVVTVDSPIDGTLTCSGRSGLAELDVINLPGIKHGENWMDLSLSYKDVAWLRSKTKLPIIAKGILTALDALQAIRAGANAILVSNHGGREMDSAPATIEVLPEIVDAVNLVWPRRDVYVDGGIRNGWDVYKAIASGAKMVFIGRPILWGLAKGGEQGVRKVLDILREEFQEVMLLSGASNPSEISRDNLLSSEKKGADLQGRNPTHWIST